MTSARISKTKLKPRLLEYLRKVQSSGKELVITERGRPVLKIVPYREKPSEVIKALRGSVTKYQAPLKPVHVRWSTKSTRACPPPGHWHIRPLLG